MKQKEKTRKEKLDAKQIFKDILEKSGEVALTTPWRKIKEKYSSEAWFNSLDGIEKLRLFENHIRELERQDSENIKAEKEKLRKHSRESRAAFRVFFIFPPLLSFHFLPRPTLFSLFSRLIRLFLLSIWDFWGFFYFSFFFFFFPFFPIFFFSSKN